MSQSGNHLEVYGESAFGITAIRIRETLLVTLPADLGSGGMMATIHKISAALEQQPAKSLILECSALRYMDLVEYSNLKKYVADMASLQGMVTYIVGINPGIAAYLALKDADLSGIRLMQSLEDALDALDDLQ